MHPFSNQKEMFSSDDIWLSFNWGVGWAGGKKRPQGNIRGQVRAFVVEQRKSVKAEPLLRIVWSKSRNKLITLNYFMLSFTPMKFHGLWVLDIKWILKVFHLTNDAVNPTWDVWFTFQVASTFTRILYSPFYPRLVRQTCHFFNMYFWSRSYTWPKFWRPRFRSRGQTATSLMLYSFAGFSCLFLWVLIFCFYTCGLLNGKCP